MEKLLLRMHMNSIEQVRAAYIAYVRTVTGNNERGRKDLTERGYVETQCDTLLDDSGRQVHSLFGKKWVLDKTKHEEYVATELSKAAEWQKLNKEDDKSKTVVGSEVLIDILCPKCSDTMIVSSVCPACEAGKSGYKFAYFCSCGVEFFSKEKL